MRSIHLTSSWKWILFLLVVGAAIGCGPDPIPEKPVPADSPQLARAKKWVRTTLRQLSPEQKIAQLLMVEAPADTTGMAWLRFRRHVSEYNVGGVLLTKGNRGLQRAVVDSLEKWQQLPVWVALDVGPEWKKERGVGSLTQVGASGSDSLAFHWGETIGKECRYLGADFAFVSAAQVISGSGMGGDALSSDPSLVVRMGNALCQGIRSLQVQPCLRSPQNNPDSLSVSELAKRDLLPLRTMLPDNSTALQLSHQTYSELDSLPLSISPHLQSKLIRRDLGFNGLVFSPSFSQDSSTHDAPLMALRAGTDMVVAPDSVEATLVHILQEVVDEKLNKKTLDEKVEHLLLEKALVGRDTLSGVSISPRIDFSQEQLTAADRKISRTGFVLLRDSSELIPIQRLHNRSIAVLAVGEQPTKALKRGISPYCDCDHFALPAVPDSQQTKSTLKGLAKHDLVVAVLQSPELSGFPDLGKWLGDLQHETKLIVAHWGNPKDLVGLDSIQTLVHAPLDRPMTQELFGQYLFGASPASGRLPYPIAGQFSTGHGLDRAERIRLAYGTPAEVGAKPEQLNLIDSIARAGVYTGTFPGCQVLAAYQGQVFYHKAFGFHDYDQTQRVRLNDVYDIASITKIAATTLMAMWSWEKDHLQLTSPLKDYLPELDNDSISIKDITPEQLLIHRSGLPPGLPIYKYISYSDSTDSLRATIFRPERDSLFGVRVAKDLYFRSDLVDTIWYNLCRVTLDPERRYKYSDVSMFLMKKVLEKTLDAPLDRLVQRHFYEPLGLRKIGYKPKRRFDKDRIVPTENDRWWRRQVLQGDVHDPATAIFGGVGGQAGLFSNAADLAVLMQMLLNDGSYGGRRLLHPATVKRFVSRHRDSHRGLGFDMQKAIPKPGKGMVASQASTGTFGHTGFTGTCVWADPEHDLVFVFLSNRVHPTANNKKINAFRIRQEIQRLLYEALDLIPEVDEPATYLVDQDSIQDSTVVAELDSSDCNEC